MNGKEFLNQYVENKLPKPALDTDEPGRYTPEFTNDYRDLPMPQLPYQV
jgi:hypothetical protein